MTCIIMSDRSPGTHGVPGRNTYAVKGNTLAQTAAVSVTKLVAFVPASGFNKKIEPRHLYTNGLSQPGCLQHVDLFRVT